MDEESTVVVQFQSPNETVRIQRKIQDEHPTVSTQELGKKISSRQKRRETAPQVEELAKRGKKKRQRGEEENMVCRKV